MNYYLVNQYKDDDAMTKREKGVQQFRLVSNSPKKIRDRNWRRREKNSFVEKINRNKKNEIKFIK